MSRIKQSTRRSERSLAFEVLYGLCFTPAANIVALRKSFQLSPNNADKISKLRALRLANEEAQKALDKTDPKRKQSNEPIEPNESNEIDITDYENVSPHGFAWELVEGVWSHTADLDAVIKDYSHNWRVGRIGRIEITILRLSIYEILYREDIPTKVAINESMELSKEFGDSHAHTFINGILDAIVKAVETNKLPHKKNSPPV